MRLKVVIDLQQNSALQSAAALVEQNNVSVYPKYNSNGYRGFLLSENASTPISTLDGSYKFFSKQGYPGWMSRRVSREDGSFSGKGIMFTVRFTLPTKVLHIVFDAKFKEYATELKVRTETEDFIVQNREPEVLVFLSQETSVVNVYILEWSKPGTNAKVTLFDPGNSFTLLGSTVESVEYSEQAWGNSFELSTGLMQQYADITFRDTKGFLQNMSDAGILTNFMPLTIYLEYRGEWQELGTYLTDVWSVDKVDNRVTVSCKDDTRTFAERTIDLIVEDTSVNEQLQLISAQLPSIDIIPREGSSFTDPFTGESVEMTTHLNACIGKDVYYQGVAAEKVISELCDRWMLRMYWEPKLKKYVVMEAW